MIISILHNRLDGMHGSSALAYLFLMTIIDDFRLDLRPRGQC